MTLDDLLRPIDPPPGGLARLRVAIADDDRRRTRRWNLGFALATAAAVLVAWFAIGGRTPAPPPVPTERSALVADPTVGAQFYWTASSHVVAREQPAPIEPRHGPLPMVTFRDRP